MLLGHQLRLEGASGPNGPVHPGGVEPRANQGARLSPASGWLDDTGRPAWSAVTPASPATRGQYDSHKHASGVEPRQH